MTSRSPVTVAQPIDDAELLRLWRAGHDTVAIAVELAAPEYDVERRLHAVLAWERAQA